MKKICTAICIVSALIASPVFALAHAPAEGGSFVQLPQGIQADVSHSVSRSGDSAVMQTQQTKPLPAPPTAPSSQASHGSPLSMVLFGGALALLAVAGVMKLMRTDAHEGQ